MSIDFRHWRVHFETEKIDIEKYGMYMEMAGMLCNDSITFKSTIYNFLKYIISKGNISILDITTPNLIKKIFTCLVRPGVFETLAVLFPKRELIRDDFPTFDLPMKATPLMKWCSLSQEVS